MKKNIIFFILFIAMSLTTFTILHTLKNIKIDEYLQTKTTNYEQNYNALYHEYMQLSEVIFKTNINTKSVLNIFKDAKTSSIEDKVLIRERLHSELKETYSLLQEYNIKQLHFHLPNNESFLRFHRPSKFGDDLTQIRETVRYVNRTHKSIDGFEEGRIYNGYRFVFPLFYKNEYLGSVEVSFSTLAMSLEFIHDYNVFAHFLILKENIESKVFTDEKSNYKDSIFHDFSIEKNEIKTLKKYMTSINVPPTDTTKQIFNTQWRENNSFSLYDSNLKEVVTFIKVKNPVTGKISGIFTVKSSPQYIYNIRNTYILSLIFLNTFIFLVLLSIYKEVNYRAELESKNKTLSSILNEADSGIALMDLKGNFLKVNQVYSNLLGYSKDELLKLNCLNITKQDEKEDAISYIQKAIQEGNISKVRKICITKDSKEIHLEFSLTLLPTQNAFIAVINPLDDKLELESLNKGLQELIMQEVIKNREKEKKLQEQARLAQMGEMISMIAHQWRQPLGAISSSTIAIQLKQESGKFDLDKKEERVMFLEYMNSTLNKINTYVHHLSQTIDDFRDFFKPNKKQELLSLDVPVIGALNIIEESMKSKGIEISYLFETYEKTLIYKNEIMQVVINILKNAEDNFIEKKIKNPKIKITTTQENKEFIISVTDNGGGIPSDIISKIFDPYFSTKHDKNGTGLGLYMSKNIVQKHNHGKLLVQNTENGVSFKIVLIRRIDA